jgi:hypothetical protein
LKKREAFSIILWEVSINFWSSQVVPPEKKRFKLIVEKE